MGMQWRLGDGKSIDIYNDNWLPRKGPAKIISPHVPILQGALVENISAASSSDTSNQD